MSLMFTPQQQLRTCAMQIFCPGAAELVTRMTELLSASPEACEQDALAETLLMRIEDMVANKPQAPAFFAYQLHAWISRGYLSQQSATALYMAGKTLHAGADQDVELAPATRASLERLLGIARRQSALRPDESSR